MSRRTSKYVTLEAESDSEEEEYMSSEYSEDLDNLEPIVTKSKSYTDLARELESKYMDADEEEDEEEVVESRGQSSLLPTPHSPLLFLVRCKVGKEKDVCYRIAENAKEKEVFSVIQKDGLKGYVYIEAFKKQAVEEVLSGVKSVSRTKLSVVPFKEMVEAISYKKNYIINEFARIRTGKYKGDLVQIVENFEDVVTIKAVPRINGDKKYFNPEEFRTSCTKKDAGFYYNRDFYKDGFLIKTMLKNNLDFDVEPTFSELDQLKMKGALEANDKVRITKGELCNFVGVLKTIKDNYGIVSDSKSSFEVNLGDLEKFYTAGDEVSYNGVNGTIVSVSNGSAIVGMDDFTSEVKCPVSDLKKPVASKRIAPEPVKKILARRDPLVNQSVVIRDGEYKGFQGVVKDVYVNNCRVLLSSTNLFINIDRRSLNIYSISKRSITETPAFKTPGYKTPGYKTPGYKTPGQKTAEPFSDDAGVEWLMPKSKYDGTIISADGRTHIVSEFSNGIYKCRDSRVFSKDDVEFCAPEKYDNVIIMRGENEGIEGALVFMNGNVGTVRTKDGASHQIDLCDISKKGE